MEVRGSPSRSCSEARRKHVDAARLKFASPHILALSTAPQWTCRNAGRTSAQKCGYIADVAVYAVKQRSCGVAQQRY
jgi:hypothetical protein